MPTLFSCPKSTFLKPTRQKVVAAIPCFNTESFISDIVYRAKKYVDEVIVIDDGSNDNTAMVAESAGATVISHNKNKGYGEAIKSCFKEAQAKATDILVILDGDGQHNPDEIPRLLAPMFHQEADVLIGSRFLTDGQKMPQYRKFGITFITFLWNFGSSIKVSDAQSGFRGYSKKVLQNLILSESGMGNSIEILEMARKKQMIIKEVPISCLYFSSSLNVKTIRHAIIVVFTVIKLRLRSFGAEMT